MLILYASDTHVHPGHLGRFLKAARELSPQALIIGGDLIPDWKGSIEASIEPHRNWVSQTLLPSLKEFHADFPHAPVLLDLGNDDIVAARPLMEAHDGVELHLLHRRVLKIGEGLAVAGYMAVNPTPFAIKDWEKPDCRDHDGLSQPRVARAGYVTGSGRAMPVDLDLMAGTMEDDLEELSAVLESPSWLDYRFILVSHAPPKDSALDQIATGSHVGSLAVRRFVERWGATGRLLASFHGHIHESPTVSGRIWQLIGSVPCFNAGQSPQMLRALLLNTASLPESARLVTVSRSGEMAIANEGN